MKSKTNVLIEWSPGEIEGEPEFAWDDLVEELSEILKEKNPSARWLVRVEGFGWRKLNGEKVVETNNGRVFLSEILPKTDVSFTIYDDGEGKLSINNFHHDSPTGEWYYAEPAPFEEDET